MTERAYATQPGSATQPWLQRKSTLLIGVEDKAYEREADEVAQAVVSGHTLPHGLSLARIPVTQTQRENGAKPGANSVAAHSIIQHKRERGSNLSAVPAVAHTALNTPAQRLDPITRSFMEARLALYRHHAMASQAHFLSSPSPALTTPVSDTGARFDHVQIHTDAAADAAARALNARAFTVGSHVVFRHGHYAPHTSWGRGLLAHELTHVLQQQHMSMPVVQRDALPAETRATPSFDELWREFQRQRMLMHDEQAIALVPDILRLMSGNAVRDHAIGLALWLMDLGRWPLAQQALQKVEAAWRGEYRAEGPALPLAYSLFADPRTLAERAAAEARADRHDQAFRLMGLAALFAQMQLNLASRHRESGQRSAEETVLEYRRRAQEAPTPRQRRFEEERATSFGQVLGAMGRAFAYIDMTQYMQLLRAVLSLYPRLEREAIAANDTARAATYRRLAGDFRQNLTRSYMLPDARAITMESTQTAAPRGGLGYTIHGVNYREEIVTPLPGTRTPAEIGFYPSYVSNMEQLVTAIAGQEELLSELHNTPEFRREFGNRAIDLNNLATRVRVWQLMYETYQRERGAGAFEALVRLIERYLRSYTAHTEYNIRDFGVSYLSTTFPEDLLGRTVRDCGVYALTVAYEIYRVARGAQPRLPIDLTLYTMPEHVTLVIQHRGDNKHYIVNNDQIMGPYTGDILPNVARAYQATFGREFGVTPTIGVSLPGAGVSEREFRRDSWTRYQASVAWGLRTEAPTGPDDTRSEAERGDATYRRYYESLRLFNQGASGLRAALAALHAGLGGMDTTAQRERLNARLGELTAGVGALITIFEAYGPHADVAVESRAVQRQLPQHAEYLYTLPQGVTVHPLTRYGRALLRLVTLGGTLSADQQQVIQRLDNISDFHRDLDAYRAAGAGADF